MTERPVPRIAPPTDPSRPEQAYSLEDPTASPAVTVVTPVFDQAEHLDDTARSLAAQTFQQFEWVIVDDGSTEPATQKAIERASRTVRRCRVVRHQRNLGLAAARNSGFAAAAADLVMQLDGDDLLEPAALDKLHRHMVHHPAAAFAKGHTAGFGAESYVWVNGFDEPERFLQQNHADSLAMVRRSAHAAAGGYDPGIREGLEDWEFWLRCAAAGMWGTTVPEVLGWYRRRPRHGDRWANWDGSDREAAFREEMRRRYPDLWTRGMPPAPRPADHSSSTPPPPLNRLRPRTRRSLLVIGAPGDVLLEDLRVRTVAALRRSGWDCAVALLAPSAHERLAAYLSVTPDVFVVPHLVPAGATASILSYLVDSRATRVIVVWGDGPGDPCLRYLASRHPGCAFAIVEAVEGGPRRPVAPNTGDGPEILAAVAAPPGALPWPAPDRTWMRRRRRRLGVRGTVVTTDAPHDQAGAAALARRFEALGRDPASLLVLARPGDEVVPIPSVRRARHVRVSNLDDVARVLGLADAHLAPAGGSDLTAALARAVGVPVAAPGPVGDAVPAVPPGRADPTDAPRLDSIMDRLRSQAGDPRAAAPGADDGAAALAEYAAMLAASAPPDTAEPRGDRPLRLPRPVKVVYRLLLRVAPGAALALRDRVRRRVGLPPATTDLRDLT